MGAAEFQAAGLYDPAAPDAAERLEFLEWMRARGIAIETMIEAARAGLLTALPADLALRRGGLYTLDEVAARTGLSPARIAELSLAVGLPAAPGEAVFADDTIAGFRFFAEGAALFGEPSLLSFLRTVGAALSRIAEAAVSLFYVTVEGPLRAQGTTQRELAAASVRAVESIDSLQGMVHGLLRAHMRVVIERFRRTELGRSTHTARMTVGFVDLVGFTTLSTHLATRDLVAVIERFEARAYDVIIARQGRMVKLIGDEVMFVTLDAAAGCEIALALFEEFAGDPAVRPRGALATGELIVRGGDYYGPIVNLASRLAELAVPQELLVTPEVAAQAHADTLRFEPAGKRMLKGIDEPVALLTVERARSG